MIPHQLLPSLITERERNQQEEDLRKYQKRENGTKRNGYTVVSIFRENQKKEDKKISHLQKRAKNANNIKLFQSFERSFFILLQLKQS